MSDDRLITAIGRLERALSRIEAKQTSVPRAPETGQHAYASLEERHQRLRTRTQAAIDRLDRLIGASSGWAGSGRDS